MSREATTGRGGVFSHFGPRSTDEKYGGVNHVGGRTWQAIYRFTYDDLPVNGEGDQARVTIPADATLVNAYWKTETAFVGGTSYDVGLEQPDGGVIDLDGLWDALATADIDADSGSALISADLHTGTQSGALLGQRVGSEGAQLIVVETGTYTAGEATVIVEYII